jgi:hypothetical protein
LLRGWSFQGRNVEEGGEEEEGGGEEEEERREVYIQNARIKWQ